MNRGTTSELCNEQYSDLYKTQCNLSPLKSECARSKLSTATLRSTNIFI